MTHEHATFMRGDPRCERKVTKTFAISQTLGRSIRNKKLWGECAKEVAAVTIVRRCGWDVRIGWRANSRIVEVAHCLDLRPAIDGPPGHDPIASHSLPLQISNRCDTGATVRKPVMRQGDAVDRHDGEETPAPQ